MELKVGYRDSFLDFAVGNKSYNWDSAMSLENMCTSKKNVTTEKYMWMLLS